MVGFDDLDVEDGAAPCAQPKSQTMTITDLRGR
jgi:hypothetical protein